MADPASLTGTRTGAHPGAHGDMEQEVLRRYAEGADSVQAELCCPVDYDAGHAGRSGPVGRMHFRSVPGGSFPGDV